MNYRREYWLYFAVDEKNNAVTYDHDLRHSFPG